MTLRKCILASCPLERVSSNITATKLPGKPKMTNMEENRNSAFEAKELGSSLPSVT